MMDYLESQENVHQIHMENRHEYIPEELELKMHVPQESYLNHQELQPINSEQNSNDICQENQNETNEEGHKGNLESETVDIAEGDDNEDSTKPNKKQSGTKFARRQPLTIEQRVFILQRYWEFGKDYRSAGEAFVKKYPGVDAPNRNLIKSLNKKFERTGSIIDMPRTGRPSTVTSGQNIQAVADMLSKNPNQSLTSMRKELGISKTSMLRIVKKLRYKKCP